jgi:hypothetical protein
MSDYGAFGVDLIPVDCLFDPECVNHINRNFLVPGNKGHIAGRPVSGGGENRANIQLETEDFKLRVKAPIERLFIREINSGATGQLMLYLPKVSCQKMS